MADPNMSPNADVGATYNEGYRGRCELGERPAGNVYIDLPDPSCVLAERNVLQVETYTFTAANAGDDISLTFDGATINFEAGVNVTATAAAAKAAIDAANADSESLFSEYFGTIDAAVGLLTVRYAKYGSHSSSYTGTVGTTADGPVVSPTGSKAVRARAGRFVAWNPTQGDPSLHKCRMPAASTDRLKGVIRRGPYTSQQVPSNAYGLAANENYPQQAMFETWEKAIVHVETASDVNPGDPVFVLFSPESKRGVAVNSDQSSAGTGQINEFTVTPDAAADVGFHFTDLPSIIVTSVDLATDNAAIRDALNNSAAYNDLMAVPAIVTGGKVRVQWVVGQAPAGYTDDSDNAPKIAYSTHTAETPAVAAKAIRKEGATFMESRTLAQASAYVDLG